MTLREFMAALAAFFVLYVLFLAAALATPKWKKEVGVASWCNDLEIIKQVIQADVSGNSETRDELAVRAFRSRRCIQLPLPVAAFRPSGIAAEFPSFGGRPVTVIQGNLVMKDESLGRVIYVVVPGEKVVDFQKHQDAGPIHGQSAEGDLRRPTQIASECDRFHVLIS